MTSITSSYKSTIGIHINYVKGQIEILKYTNLGLSMYRRRRRSRRRRRRRRKSRRRRSRRRRRRRSSSGRRRRIRSR
jgi:hypothetical protein